MGFCRIGAAAEIVYAGLHFGEEPPISGTRGSGTIFFPGCNLRCVFCQNYQISQEFKLHPSQKLTTGELASAMIRLQDAGAHNINFVSPSHMVFQMADAIGIARHQGLQVPIVYNSNGYDSLAVLRKIRGLVDIYLPDIKYLDNNLGKRYSAVVDYAETIPAVLGEMLDQVGDLQLDDQGIAVRGLLVRHLVLPGCLEDSRNCLRWLAGLSSTMSVSIMAQYSPQHRAYRYPEINRCLTGDEYQAIVDYALELGLDNAFVQDLASQEQQRPDFTKPQPFVWTDCGPAALGKPTI